MGEILTIAVVILALSVTYGVDKLARIETHLRQIAELLQKNAELLATKSREQS